MRFNLSFKLGNTIHLTGYTVVEFHNFSTASGSDCQPGLLSIKLLPGVRQCQDACHYTAPAGTHLILIHKREGDREGSEI